MKTVIDDVHITVDGGEMSEDEIKQYLFHIRNKHKSHSFDKVDIKIDGEYVELKYWFKPEPFERIRRVTGYLTGSLDRWNSAKQAEERDRVKHI